jgi:RimJ/RimL family protein N-acetyltransferase
MHAVLPIPTIETERLLLRPHTIADFDDCAAMWGDANVTRHIGGRPFTREEVWARLHRYVGHWVLLEFGYWHVSERGSNRFVGEVGFADFKRDIDPPFDGAPEAGWVLSPAAHGKGFATEAVRAALAWGEPRFPSPRTVCIIDPENAASIRVAGKCGYREYARTSYKGGPAILFERPNALHR